VNADTARTALRISPFLVWGGIVLAWCLLVLPELGTYALGTPATATITRCETTVSTNNEGNTVEETTCFGSWQTDDTRREGRIYGGERHEEGERLPVRATSSAAATLDTLSQSLWLTGFGVALGGVAHAACWFSFSRQLKKAEASGT
jgi:hypothetical protein